MSESPLVSMSRTLDATPERVWRALTDETELAQWYWPRSINPSMTADVRAGGSYRFSATSPEMAVSGRYGDIDGPHHLAMGWQWDGEERVSTVTIDLADAGADRTLLTVTHSDLSAEDVESHTAGWSDCLDRLPGHLATHRS